LSRRVVVYSPQIYENFSLKSGEGLSIAFVVIWLAGDLCNLAGAWIAGLLPTMIILAGYVRPFPFVTRWRLKLKVSRRLTWQYTLCDTALLIQIYYYRWLNTGTLARPQAHHVQDTGEATPLLSSSNNSAHESEKKRSLKRHVLEYVGMILCLVGAGIVAWAISQRVQGVGDDEEPRPEEVVEWKSQLMGYCSAMLYCERLFAVLAGFWYSWAFLKWVHEYPKYVSHWRNAENGLRLRRDQ